MLKPYPNELSCSECGRRKPIEQFAKNGVRSDGSARRRSYCMACYNIRQARYLQNPAARRKYLDCITRWRKRNPGKVAEYYQKVKGRKLASANQH